MPFYLTPVTGSLLVGRRAEIGRLLADLGKKDGRAGFSLTGVRRIGKTSILKEAKRRLEKKGIVVIYVSVWDALPDTLDAFVARLFDQTMDAFKGSFSLDLKIRNLIRMSRDGVAGILRHVGLSVHAGDEILYTVSYLRGDESDAASAISNVFSMIDKLAVRAKKRCVLIIDEFPSLAELKIGKKAIGRSIIRKIRTVNEDYENTSMVISGSFAHTMQEVALSSSAPFYKQLTNLEIRPLDREAMREFVRIYVRKKIDEEGLDALEERSGGIPYNLQMLGRELGCMEGEAVDAASVSRAVALVLQREGAVHFQEYLGMMQSTETGVVKAMAVSGSTSPSDIAAAGNMSLNGVTALLQSLLAKGILQRTGRGRYRFADDMFRAWLSDRDG